MENTPHEQPKRKRLFASLGIYTALALLMPKFFLSSYGKTSNKLVDWFDERTGLKDQIVEVATHPVPPKATWAYVFGTAILTSFIVQIVTGISLATLFVPSANDAYRSLQYISNQAPFGGLIRGIHYFGASSMVLFVGIHAIRVYLTASYKYPRELNWLSGVFLFILTILMGFTGQILRWDQDAIWTLAVGAQQALRVPWIGTSLATILLSGQTISSGTIGHVFALHVFVFPAILIGFVIFHVYLVLHNGISEPPKLGEPVDPKTYKQKYQEMLKRIGVPFWPDAAWRDLTFSTLVVIAILACALCFGPKHLTKPPDPSNPRSHPIPDWYLVWYFALQAVDPHAADNMLIILLPILIFGSLFAVPFLSNRGERSLRRRPWAIGLVLLTLGSIAALEVEGYKEPWKPTYDAKPLPANLIGASSGPIYEGAQVFNTRGCVLCHKISGYGGIRGPDLTEVGNRLTHDQIVIRIVNGGYSMPPYAGNIAPQDLQNLAIFLESRKPQ